MQKTHCRVPPEPSVRARARNFGIGLSVRLKKLFTNFAILDSDKNPSIVVVGFFYNFLHARDYCDSSHLLLYVSNVFFGPLELQSDVVEELEGALVGEVKHPRVVHGMNSSMNSTRVPNVPLHSYNYPLSNVSCDRFLGLRSIARTTLVCLGEQHNTIMSVDSFPRDATIDKGTPEMCREPREPLLHALVIYEGQARAGTGKQRLNIQTEVARTRPAGRGGVTRAHLGCPRSGGGRRPPARRPPGNGWSNLKLDLSPENHGDDAGSTLIC
ncbi:hypothetical protein EVAR_80547_1 [Eumeta japonica]|uniref:Uncharacterized protein n=1 Tax=Eumeta variegata TaxID=151549 RepID=A0A4C1TLB3_EUMVA|nr:hypothetical protein EVAR_80547_1 [Eumeta japonica]